MEPIFNRENVDEIFRVMGTFAATSDLSFNWYDAAMLSQEIRKHFKEKPKIGRGNIESFEKPHIQNFL